MEIITAIGPNIVDKLFDGIEISRATPPRPGDPNVNDRLYKIQLEPIVVTAAAETWEKIRDLFKQIARDGWEAAKANYDLVIGFIGDSARELGNMAEEYQQLLLEKLHELIRKTSEFLLKSIIQRVEIGQQVYTLSSVNLEMKLLFSASIEASVATLGKFLGTGEMTIKGTYSISTS